MFPIVSISCSFILEAAGSSGEGSEPGRGIWRLVSPWDPLPRGWLWPQSQLGATVGCVKSPEHKET